jgi:hypothetical protein
MNGRQRRRPSTFSNFLGPKDKPEPAPSNEGEDNRKDGTDGKSPSSRRCVRNGMIGPKDALFVSCPRNAPA